MYRHYSYWQHSVNKRKTNYENKSRLIFYIAIIWEQFENSESNHVQLQIVAFCRKLKTCFYKPTSLRRLLLLFTDDEFDDPVRGSCVRLLPCWWWWCSVTSLEGRFTELDRPASRLYRLSRLSRLLSRLSLNNYLSRNTVCLKIRISEFVCIIKKG